MTSADYNNDADVIEVPINPKGGENSEASAGS